MSERLSIRDAAKRVGRDWRYIRDLAERHKITSYARGSKKRRYYEFYEDELRSELDDFERVEPETVKKERPKHRRTSKPESLHPAALAM